MIGRTGHINAINKNGLRLITPAGVHVLKVPAAANVKDIKFNDDDVIFITMKSQDTETALQVLKAEVNEIPVFCFQNGVRNEEIAAQYFRNVYGASFGIGSEFLNDGEVICRRDPPGRIVLGRYPQGMDNLAADVAKRLRTTGFFVLLSPDVMPYKWGKLMGNLANAVDAITNSGGEDVRIIINAAVSELTSLLEQAGIKVISQDQLAKETPEVKMPRPPSSGTPMHSSTWQSLARRQGTVETEYLNGEVVRLAKKLGKRAPVNEKLVQITLEMAANREKPGKYTPAQLISVLGLNNAKTN